MKKLYSIILLGFIFNACNDEEDKPKFGFQGQIVSVTNTPLAGIEVTFFREESNDPIKTTVSDNDGQFVTQLENGHYRIEVLANGYSKFLKSISVNKKPEFLKISLSGEVTFSGRIISSQTGKGLSGAAVSFFRDNSSGRLKENTTGVELICYTNDLGYFEVVGAPSGVFIQVVEKDGFFTRNVKNISFHDGVNELDRAIAVEIPVPGAIRIVLSWNALPIDLDSHLTGPDGVGGRFHMYYRTKNPIPTVSLDVDDMMSYGPETTTITQLLPGTYRYSVHNYHDGVYHPEVAAIGIANSPTVVEVYDSNSLLAAFVAPPFSEEATTWRVFEIIVSNTGLSLDPKKYYYFMDSEEDF